jgi:esterase/lipase superfamily enzyme
VTPDTQARAPACVHWKVIVAQAGRFRNGGVYEWTPQLVRTQNLAGLFHATHHRLAAYRSSVQRPVRFQAAFLVGFALTVHAVGAAGADFDLCVRGTTLDDTRTVRLRLRVDGADVAAFAPQLGAALANTHLWDRSAQKVYGSPYDPELCGDNVAEERSLSVTLTDEQARALAAESTRGSDDGLLTAIEHVLGAGSVSVSPPPGPDDQAAGSGEPGRYRVMRVYYATDRRQTASEVADEHFGGERGGLVFGAANVTIPATHKRGKMEAPSILRLQFRADPNRHILLQSLRALDAQTWRVEIAKQAAGLNNPGILLFIHGYNTSFADAACRVGQLAYDLNFAGAPVVFSWPSRGELAEYTFDEQSAEWAIPDMKAVLASLATVAPGTPIYVIAHSMGNRVLTRGYKSLLDEDRSKRRAFKQLVLAAPDLDADVFRREIAPAMLGLGPRVTLYASSNDKALIASRKVHGGYHRLGESGKDIVVMPELDTVDASTASTDFLGHGYFAQSEGVVSDIKHLIHESLRPQERERFSLDPVRDLVIGLHWRIKSQLQAVE